MFAARDIMQTNLITVSGDTSISETIDILATNKITGMPVVEDDMKLIGIISEKDVLSIAYRIMSGTSDAVTNTRKARDIMTANVVSFRPDDNLADICQCFVNKPFRRVTILQDDKLVGLISRKDIVSHAFDKNRVKR